MSLFILSKVKLDPRLQESDVLWRYLDAAKFLSLLDGPGLHLTRGDQFADKFEGTFTKSLKHAIEASYEKQDIQMTVEEFKKRLRERVFVNCWRQGKDDSMAMWSLYGRSEFSVAVTTTVGQLRKEACTWSLPYDTSIKKVTYLKHWRDPELNANPYSNVFSYKVTAYDYENEVRVIVDRFHETFDEEPAEKGLFMPLNLNRFLRSIVVAPEAPEWFFGTVQRACIKYGITTPVHRSKLATEPH